MAVSSPTRRLSAAVTGHLFILIICASATHAATTNTSESEGTSTLHEYETTLETLRDRGFTLFTNAIATSDIKMQLLSGNSTDVAYPFTLFAPKDVQLFTLDMESSAEAYVNSLRYHVIPSQRLTFADLLNLTSSFLGTLLPQHSVLIGKTHFNGEFGVAIDGNRLTEPDLFLGSRFAVHGIDGILFTGLNDFEYFNFSGDSPDLILPPDLHYPPDLHVSGSDVNISEVSTKGTPNRVAELIDLNNGAATSPSEFDPRIPTAVTKKLGRLNQKGRGRRRRHRRKRRHNQHPMQMQSKWNRVTRRGDNGAIMY